MDPESPAPASDTPSPTPAPAQAANPDLGDKQDFGTVSVSAPKPISSPYLKAQDAGIQNDFAMGHIKPETYQDLFDNKDTLGKVGTLFGLIVGGAGAGLTHQPNAVLEMMNKEIQNDLQGQIHSNENAQNFYRLNQAQQRQVADIDKMRKEGLLTDAQAKLAKTQEHAQALATSRIQMNRASFHDLVMRVNKLPIGSPERQQAEQTLAMMNNAIDKENYDIADRAAAQSALAHAVFNSSPEGQKAGGGDKEEQFKGNNQLLRMSGNAPLAEDKESKHMPGFSGAASVPLSGGDRQELVNGKNFQDEMARFKDWTAHHSGDLSPADQAYGAALAQQLSSAYRAASNGGVYKAGEQDFINQAIDPDPTKFLNKIRVLPKLEAVQQEHRKEFDNFVSSKGMQYEGPKLKYHEGQTGKDKAKGTVAVYKNGKWVPKK